MNDKSELIRRAELVSNKVTKRVKVTVQEIADILGISRQATYAIMDKWLDLKIVSKVEKVNGYPDWYWLGKDE